MTMSEKARIVFVNRFFFPDTSATAQLLSDLAFALASSRFEVHVVCSRQLYADPDAKLLPRESIRGVRVHRVASTRFGRARLPGRAIDYASFYLTAGWTLARLLRRRDVLIAETDPPLISLVACLAAGLRRATLVNWLQDVFPEVASRLGANPLPPVLDRSLRVLRDASLRAARCNVVLGERMRDYIVGRVPQARCRIIENWADTGGVTVVPAERSELRQRLGLTGRFVIGYSGNLGRAHEFDTLLGAARLLPPEVAFLFIGGGQKHRKLEARVAQEGLRSFYFAPYQPRESLSDSLAAADVHWVSLLPSLEGLIVPSKFYGVLAAGRPVLFIGDEQGELARVINATGCGAVIKAGDSPALARIIEALRSDPYEVHRMGSVARQLICNRYGMSAAIDHWIALLTEVQSQEAQPHPHVRAEGARAGRSAVPPRSAP